MEPVDGFSQDIIVIDSIKPIETINRGELVWSREEFGNNYDYRTDSDSIIIKASITRIAGNSDIIAATKPSMRAHWTMCLIKPESMRSWGSRRRLHRRLIKSDVMLKPIYMKVADLISKTGISKSTMDKIYNEQTSRMDFETMDKICEALDIGVGDLFTYVPNESLGKEK